MFLIEKEDDSLAKRGILYVISGPSGVGKGTVRAELFKRKDIKLSYSVSATTRAPRAGEVDGKDYFFKTVEEFEEMIKNRQLAEYAQFVGNYYGTPIQYVEEQLEDGQNVVLEIDVQGAEQVKRVISDGVFIFIAPPNLKELRRRLEGRGTEANDIINGRINMATKELFLMQEYDYTVVNDTVEAAADKIMHIIKAEQLRTKYIYDSVREMILDEIKEGE